MLKKRVALALSGGVDSAVSAVLLKEQGYEVVCFFMKFWSEAISDERMNSCCNAEAYHNAENLARQLNIPIYTLNFNEKFKNSVVNHFLRSFAAGITPNPCIQCNQFIKFGEFLKKAKQLGFDHIATGHYAQIEKKDQLYYLKKGADVDKDQSYFLYRLNQDILKHTIFPVGELKKTKVREIAKENNLKIHSKKESQEICFVSNDDIKGFLQRNIKLSPGEIIDIDTKKVLGKHQGLEIFTIGQRKGLGLPQGPWYVVEKNIKENTVFVTKDPTNKLLRKQKIFLKELNWISGREPRLPLEFSSQIRYNQTPKNGKLSKENGKIYLQFDIPVRAITPGQSAVFYSEDYVIGGGIIV